LNKHPGDWKKVRASQTDKNTDPGIIDEVAIRSDMFKDCIAAAATAPRVATVR
jgi:hypothetical protein